MDLSVFALDRACIRQLCLDEGIFPSPSRVEGAFSSIFRPALGRKAPVQGLSRRLESALARRFSPRNPVEIARMSCSTADGSVKFAVRSLRDGALAETVLIPERGRLTVCVSSQVGCAQGCRFCHTGTLGLTRSLAADEIVGQVLLAQSYAREHGVTGVGGGASEITNVVFMGMGEPLDNLGEVLRSVSILTDPLGFRISQNKVTVSTVGLLPQLDALLASGICGVALSLHSPFDAERSRMLPVNLRHPLADVISCARKHLGGQNKRHLFVQYTLLRAVNDSAAHAAGLAALLSGIPAKVNLIPLNEHRGAAFRRPDLGHVARFQAWLKEAGLVATVRLSKGRDIDAACGQLAAREAPAAAP